MKKVDVDPDQFIDSLPDEVKGDIQVLDKKISAIMKDETRVLWSGVFWGGSQQNIIGYGDLVCERPKANVEWFLVGLSSQKNYISVYVSSVEDGKYLVEKYADKLGKVKVGKSSISFKRLSDINLDQLIELIERAKELSTSR